MTGFEAPSAESVAAALAATFDGIYHRLLDAAVAYQRLLGGYGAGLLGPFDAPTRARMRQLSYATMDAHPITAGAGIVFDSDRIGVSGAQLQWYVRGEDGYEPYGFVNDKRSSEFYDYLELPWFAVPRDTGNPGFAGPYLDFLGVDEFVLTCSVPVNVGAAFAGTAAVDIEVRAVERRFLELARGVPDRLALTNLEGRIICATSSRFLPGDRVEPAPDLRSMPLPTGFPTMNLYVVQNPPPSATSAGRTRGD